MFLTSALVAGGIIYGGVKTYQEKRKKEKTPWTYYAERLQKKNNTLTLLAPSRHQKEPSSVTSAWATLQTFKFDTITPFFSDSRKQQLQEISSLSDEIERSDAERKANQDLIISSVSLSLATLGSLVYAPLSLLSVPGTIWVSLFIFQDLYKYSFKEKRLHISLIDTIFVIGNLTMGYYFAACLGNWFYSLSRKLLSKTEDHSRQSLINVFGEQPRFVWLFSDEVEVRVPFETLRVGDVVVVHASETIPVDGIITLGTASVDQHTLTGESQPAEKGIGEQVFASTVVLSGKILIEVEKAGEDTVAAQIGDILSRTADFKSSLQSWGEKIGDRSVPPTLGIGILILPVLGASSALAALNSCFGLYMRVLAPLSMLTYLNLASQHGILVKDGRVLDILKEVDTVVFDKTGTLTLEQPHVGHLHPCGGVSESDLLTYAAAAEYKQTHPIAKAILQSANERGLSLPEIEHAKYEVGYGIKVNLSHLATRSEVIRVGSARFMEMEQIAVPAEIKEIHQSGHANGYSFVYVAVDNQLYGAIELRATIRPEAKQIISDLQERNMSLVIISGDNEQPTRKLAQELGIENYFAETLPENKAELIEQLQKQGKSVCFVGDGINDSIALKKANVSISLRGASTIATDTAQIVLMDKSLNQLVQLFDIAQNFERNMKINLIATIVPGLTTIGGVFFLHFGILHSILLNNIGLAVGSSNAMWPLFKHQKNEPDQRLAPDSGCPPATFPNAAM